MTNKWDAADAERYAESFANFICTEFFRTQDKITGLELIDITEIKQLNLLVIKNLYDKWQEEMRRLKSPFFDYGHPDVADALSQFMNVLSKHITLEERTFNNLLAKAAFDTLQLAQKPSEFFEGQLRNLPDFKLTEEWFVKNEKYFLINRMILDGLRTKLDKRTVFANEALAWLPEVMQSAQPVDASDILADFNKILPLNKSHKEEGQKVGKSFFDDALEKALASQRAGIVPTTEAPEIVTIAARPKPIISEKPDADLRLNERHVGVAVTLNERRNNEGATSLSDQLQKRRISNLKEGISINQRYLFIKNLFGGDQDAFVQSLEALETFSNFSDARHHVDHHIAPQFNWNKDTEEAEEFYAHLGRRFV